MIHTVSLYGGAQDGEEAVHTTSPLLWWRGEAYKLSFAWSQYFGRDIAVPVGFPGMPPTEKDFA